MIFLGRLQDFPFVWEKYCQFLFTCSISWLLLSWRKMEKMQLTKCSLEQRKQKKCWLIFRWEINTSIITCRQFVPNTLPLLKRLVWFNYQTNITICFFPFILCEIITNRFVFYCLSFSFHLFCWFSFRVFPSKFTYSAGIANFFSRLLDEAAREMCDLHCLSLLVVQKWDCICSAIIRISDQRGSGEQYFIN